MKLVSLGNCARGTRKGEEGGGCRSGHPRKERGRREGELTYTHLHTVSHTRYWLKTAVVQRVITPLSLLAATPARRSTTLRCFWGRRAYTEERYVCANLRQLYGVREIKCYVGYAEEKLEWVINIAKIILEKLNLLWWRRNCSIWSLEWVEVVRRYFGQNVSVTKIRKIKIKIIVFFINTLNADTEANLIHYQFLFLVLLTLLAFLYMYNNAPEILGSIK